MGKEGKSSSNQSLTDNQSPQIFNTALEFSQVQNKSISMTQTSELFGSLYEPTMRAVSQTDTPQIKEKLKSQGIQYESGGNHSEFQKSCIKTDWQSVVYEMKYGKFKMKFTLIRVSFVQNVICRSFYNKGSFGEIWKFDCYQAKKQFVIKSIGIKNHEPSSIDLALREVFLAKIFSALQMGPKFSTIFQYDAILFDNALIYSMQFCNTCYSSNQVQRQLKEKQLLQHLKTLHSLSICHKDIKYLNIGWSPSFHKFVFLDFNFSQVIKQPVGYKTFTKFTGTYTYSSNEMKKCYMLKKEMFVDLYYNDLFCLEGTWRQMEQNFIRKKNLKVNSFISEIQHKSSEFLHIEEENQTNQMKIKILINQSLVNYFLIKMTLFNGDIPTFSKLIHKEPVLFETLKRIAYNVSLVETTSDHIDSNKKQLYLLSCQRLKHRPTEMPFQLLQLDSILASSQIKNMDKNTKKSLFTKILQISESESLFSVCWATQSWKEDLFFFIDVYSNPSRSHMRYRKKLIQLICKQINKNNIEDMSETLRFRQVLLFYFGYFEQKGNLTVMEKILGYFVLMEDELSCDDMENRILLKLKSQCKLAEYIHMNLMMFLGKFVLTRKNHIVNTNKFIENLQHLQESSFLTSQINETEGNYDANLLKIIHPTVTQMQALRNIRIYFCRSQNYSQLKENLITYLRTSREYLNEDIIRILEKIIGDRYFQNVKNVAEDQSASKLKLNHHFLQKYMFKMRVQHITTKLTKNNVISLLESEEFTRQFPVFIHTSILCESSAPKIRQIYKDYCVMGRNQKYFCNLSYMESLITNLTITQIQTMCIDYLESLQLSHIKNMEDLVDYQVSLLGLVTSILCLKKKVMYKFSQENSNKIYAKITHFLQVCARLTLTHKCVFCGGPLSIADKNKQDLPLCQAEFQKNRKYLELLLLQFMQKTNESCIILLKIVDRKQNMLSKEPMLIHCLCSLQGGSSETQSAISQCIIQLTERHVLPTMQLLFNIQILFQTVLKTYVQRCLYGKAVEITRGFCREMLNRKLPLVLPIFIDGITKFVDLIAPVNILRQIAQSQATNQLKTFASCPVFTYFMGLSFSKLIFYEEELQPSVQRRLIIICIFFIQIFNQGIFRPYKLMLFKQAKKLSHFHVKKQAILQRRFGSSSKLLIFVQKKIDIIDKNKEIKQCYKMKCHQILQAAKAKVELYEGNIRSKKPISK